MMHMTLVKVPKPSTLTPEMGFCPTPSLTCEAQVKIKEKSFYTALLLNSWENCEKKYMKKNVIQFKKHTHKMSFKEIFLLSS